MAEPFDEFMEDVAKDMRQEQLEKLWKKYGRIAMWTVAGMLLMSSAWMIYSNNMEENLKITSEKFSKAQSIESSDSKVALGIYNSIEASDSPTYYALSQISIARVLTNKGGADFRKGQAILDNLYNNKNVNMSFRDYAKYLSIKNELDTYNITNISDQLSPDIHKRLEEHSATLTELSKQSSSWKSSAMDLNGLINILLKNYSKASELYIQILQDKSIPNGLKMRAEMMQHHILKNMK